MTVAQPGGPPLYRRIAAELREAIASGTLPPQAKLPSESQLVQRYQTTHTTIRRALAVLQDEGLTESVHGVGVFVRRRPLVRRVPVNRLEQAQQAGHSLFEAEMQEQGGVPTRLLTSVRPEHPALDVGERLRIPSGDLALVRRRVMCVDDEPVKVTASYFRMDLATGTLLEEEQLLPRGMHQFMEQDLGRRYGRYVEELQARMPTADETRVLRLGHDVPVIRILHSDYDVNDDPLEVVESIFAGDKHIFVTEWPERPQESSDRA